MPMEAFSHDWHEKVQEYWRLRELWSVTFLVKEGGKLSLGHVTFQLAPKLFHFSLSHLIHN